jgi:hypothetical protein
LKLRESVKYLNKATTLSHPERRRARWMVAGSLVDRI